MTRGAVATVAAALVLTCATGCGGHDAAQPDPTPSVSSSPAPPYDPSLPPARAVLALVPHAATTLSLTDFDQVRAQYGAEPGEPDVWRRATRHSPLLSTGLLRPYAAELRGFTPDDVAWEAHYSGGPDAVSGWVLGFRSGTDMGAVRRAVAAGTGPLAGAHVDVADHLVTSARLAADDSGWVDLADLVGTEAQGTYVARGCREGSTDGQRLQPLTAYGISLDQGLATARLGAGREDLFTRMRLGEGTPAFAAAFGGGAADPSSGRIGFTLTDPVEAARLTLAGTLPFAVCPDD